MPALTVGELEEALFSEFPRADAEPWDSPGLAVGMRSAPVGKVAVNLDMSTAAVLAAASAGCDVLVTHHPAYIKEGPGELGPSDQTSATGPGRMFYEAARRSISAIAMHTNADRAVSVREEYAALLGMRCTGNFEHLLDPSRDVLATGFGALLEPPAPEFTLADLAARCLDAFGGAPRVWGDPARPITRVALLNGSWSDPTIYPTCADAGVDAIVVGERRYHLCLDAAPHLSTIELGHDKSELAIEGVLASALERAGIDSERIVRLGCSRENWWTPAREVGHV